MKPLILIVEDEFIIALDMKEMLEKEGYECIVDIFSVEKAIDAIESRRPSLVLIDINLKKEKDGIELAKYLLKKDTIPYIFVTSYSNPETLNRVNETKPHGYVVKPFKPSDLISTVAIVLNNYTHKKIDVNRSLNNITTEAPFILKEVIAYINNNITEKITIEDLTALTNWKAQHFQNMFKTYIGTTPSKYINEKKIEKAASMLVDSAIPIVQISYELGFKSHSNFCALFKKQTNQTPENFRNLHKIKQYL